MANDDEQPNQGHPTVEDTTEEEEEQEEASFASFASRVSTAYLAKESKRGSNSRGESYTLAEYLNCSKAFIAASNDHLKGVHQKVHELCSTRKQCSRRFDFDWRKE